MRVFCISMLLAAGCASSPKPLALPPATPELASPRTVDLELTDTTAAGTKTTHFELAMVDDAGWSKLRTRTPTGVVVIEATSSRRHHAGPAVLHVRLERDLQGEPDLKLAQSTIFYAGRRTVLGHVEGPSGSTEVAVVTR